MTVAKIQLIVVKETVQSTSPLFGRFFSPPIAPHPQH